MPYLPTVKINECKPLFYAMHYQNRIIYLVHVTQSPLFMYVQTLIVDPSTVQANLVVNSNV